MSSEMHPCHKCGKPVDRISYSVLTGTFAPGGCLGVGQEIVWYCGEAACEIAARSKFARHVLETAREVAIAGDDGRLVYRPRHKYARMTTLSFGGTPPAEPDGAKLTADRAARRTARAERERLTRERSGETILDGLAGLWDELAAKPGDEARDLDRVCLLAFESQVEERDILVHVLQLGLGFGRDVETLHRVGRAMTSLSRELAERWALEKKKP